VSLTVNGTVVTQINGQWQADVSLEEGHNTIIAKMVDPDGVSSTASISVSLDLTPPYLTIESHTDGQVVYTDTIAVSGLVNDIVRGTIEEDQASVLVNGVSASIVNRSYLAENIPLVAGDSVITVVGADAVGNTAQTQINVTYQVLVGHHLALVSGQNQTAAIEESLAAPLVVQVLDDNNLPLADKNVVFRVTQGSGMLDPGGALEGKAVLALTDANGMAQTTFKLGQRAGTGNHKVRARVVGYEDEVIYYASATPNIGNKLSVNSGNNQRGGVFQPLPAPFIVAVTDAGANVLVSVRE
ncbi:MAG: hypothetical protein GY785_25595, partial [Gammaproteobacteria bacterium]|nr:hypothetical protein [Gammaproteobacteria bacterium]